MGPGWQVQVIECVLNIRIEKCATYDILGLRSVLHMIRISNILGLVT